MENKQNMSIGSRLASSEGFISVAASVICLVIFGSGSFLIPSMVAITLALTLMRKRQEAVQ